MRSGPVRVTTFQVAQPRRLIFVQPALASRERSPPLPSNAQTVNWFPRDPSKWNAFGAWRIQPIRHKIDMVTRGAVLRHQKHVIPTAAMPALLRSRDAGLMHDFAPTHDLGLDEILQGRDRRVLHRDH